jgi:hypothetical protein
MTLCPAPSNGSPRAIRDLEGIHAPAGVTFADPAKRPSADGLALGAGINTQLTGWSLGLEYQGDIRANFQSHTAAIKANFKF